MGEVLALGSVPHKGVTRPPVTPSMRWGETARTLNGLWYGLGHIVVVVVRQIDR